MNMSSGSKKSKVKKKNKKQQEEFAQSMEDCADIYYTLESRLREIEAFMTSKKFRLHCEINRI